MLARWRIREAPTAKDPRRRVLMVKGAMSDVQALVRRLGPVCGRPKKEASDPEFNYSIVLHKLEDGKLAEVEAALTALAPAGAAAKTPLPRARTPLPEPVPPPPPPSEPAPGDPALSPGSAASGALGAAGLSLTPPPAPDPANPFAGFGAAAVPFQRATAHEPLSPPAVLPDLMPAANTPDPVPLGEAPSPAAEPPPPPLPHPQPLRSGTTSLPKAAPSGGPPALASEPLFGALRGIDPERTLDNLVVGSYNRFAHAAAMSLLTSPGTLYNPLVVWGGAGVGKTHLVNGLALRLQEQAPHETIWLTSGSALARAAGLAQAAGRGKELAEFAAKARALVIDDVHMTGVADHNRETLAAVVAAVLGAGRQVVVSSLYAQRHIAPLEQALGLRTDKSHAVELKTPNDAAQQSIGEAALGRLGLAPSTEERDLFCRGLLKDFTALDDHLRRVAALAALGPPGAPLGQLLREILAPDAEGAAPGADELKGRMPPAPPAGKAALAVCHPPGGETHADFLLGRAAEAAKGRGWPFPWRAAARLAYAVDPPHAAPYLLAEEALRSGAAAALVVGPPPGTDLAGQERPFRAAVLRLLGEAGMAAAVVPYARVHDPKQALFSLLDLAPRPGGAP